MPGILTPSWQKPPRGALLDRSHPFSRSMIGCWLLNELTGKLTNDLARNHIGTMQGTQSGTWGATSCGGVALFNGTNNSIAVPNAADLGIVSAFSLAAAFTPAVVNVVQGIAVKDASSAPSNPPYGLQMLATGVIQGTVTSSADATTSISGPTLTAGVRHQAVLTYDRITLRLYLDGSQVASASLSVFLGTNILNFLIGQQKSASGRWFTGSIEHAILWSGRTLLASEVASLSAAPYQMIAPLIPDAVFYSIGAGTPTTRFRRTVLTGGMADYTARIHG